MDSTVKAALIGALATVFGNVATAFGPSLLSWGQKPVFVDSEVYKDLKTENINLEKTLQEQLLQRDVYYTFRRVDVSFVKLDGDNVVIEYTNTTRLRNGTSSEKTYTHKASISDSTEFLAVSISPRSGQGKTYQKEDIRKFRFERRADGLFGSYSLPDEVIPANGTIDVVSSYRVVRPKNLNGIPFTTGRLINAPMTFNIKNNIDDPRFKIDPQSLAFDLNLANQRGLSQNETTITIPGPVFSGQGLYIEWAYK
jgi:hypothetical protein